VPSKALQPKLCSAHLPANRQPHGDKLARLRRHLDLFRQGRVLLRAGARFLNELFAEFEGFPYGEYDDQVDTVTLPITAPSRR